MSGRCERGEGRAGPVFGVGRIHHIPSHRKRQDLLAASLDAGFRAFDVAPAYGNGVNERELGIALLGRRSECEINTKFGIPVPIYGFGAIRATAAWRLADIASGRSRMAYAKRDFSLVSMRRSLEASLRRLMTDYVDTFFIHEPVEPVDPVLASAIVEEGARLRKEGKLRRLGIAGPMDAILEFPLHGEVDVIQTPLGVPAIPGRTRRRGEFVFYGAYAAYAQTGKTAAFAPWVAERLLEHPGARVILSTINPRVLREFEALVP